MKVYVLIGKDYYEPEYSEVVGVYSTMEGAQKAKENFAKTQSATYRSFYICAETVLD